MGVTLGKTAGRRFQSCLDVQDVLPATAVGGAADNTADVLLPEPPPPPEEKVALIISPPSSAAHVVGCHQCRMELHQGSLMSLVSSTSTAIDGDEIDEAIGQSLRSLEHTHTYSSLPLFLSACSFQLLLHNKLVAQCTRVMFTRVGSLAG